LKFSKNLNDLLKKQDLVQIAQALEQDFALGFLIVILKLFIIYQNTYILNQYAKKGHRPKYSFTNKRQIYEINLKNDC
jgi:hypothetical protein